MYILLKQNYSENINRHYTSLQKCKLILNKGTGILIGRIVLRIEVLIYMYKPCTSYVQVMYRPCKDHVQVMYRYMQVYHQSTACSDTRFDINQNIKTRSSMHMACLYHCCLFNCKFRMTSENVIEKDCLEVLNRLKNVESKVTLDHIDKIRKSEHLNKCLVYSILC